jgi:hypothetical protein
VFRGKETKACLRIGQSHKGPQVEAAKIIQIKGTEGFDLSIFLLSIYLPICGIGAMKAC